MFLKDFLSDFVYNQIIENYEYEYLSNIDKNIFFQVLEIFKKYDFYFIEDIILNHLDIFTMDSNDVEKQILELRNQLGENFVSIIGNDLRYLSQMV